MRRTTALIIGGALASAAASGALTGSVVSGLAIGVAILSVVAVVKRPWWGFAILAVILPINGLASALLVIGGDSATSIVVGGVKDVILLALVVVAIASGRLRRVRPEILILVSIMLVLGAVAAIWSHGLEQAAYGWRNDYEPLIVVVVAAALLDRHSASTVARILAGVAQASAVLAIVTWCLGQKWLYFLSRLPLEPGERFPSSLFTAESSWPRAFSPFSAPNEMAVGMLVILAIIWAASGLSTRSRALLTVLPVLAIGLSQSRSGYLGLILLVLLLFTLWLRARRPRAALIFLISAGTAVVAAALAYIAYQLRVGGEPSIGGHAASFSDALQIMVAHPLGVGLGNVGPKSVRFTDDPVMVESFWLLIALEAGPLALLAFIALLTRAAWIGFWANNRLASAAPLAIGASIVSQLVLPTLQDVPVSMLLWLAVGMGLVGARDAVGSKPVEPTAGGTAQPRSVSVVIPSVGRPALRQAVESALAQTSAVAQVIVVADSTGPLDLPDDERIVVERVGPGAGGNTARQRGVVVATSELIALLDDDDEWLPDRIERQLDAVAHSGVTGDQWIATSRVTMVRADGTETLYPVRSIRHEPLMEYLFWKRHPFASHGFLQASTLLFPRALAVEVPFRSGLRFHQDIDWLVSLSRRYPQLAVVQPWLPLVRYIAGAGTVSRSIVGIKSSEWAVESLLWHSPRTAGDFILTQSLGFARRTGSIAEMKSVIAFAREFTKPSVSARIYARLVLFAESSGLRRSAQGSHQSAAARKDRAPTSTP